VRLLQWGNRGIDSPAGGRLPFILRSFERRSAQGPLPRSRTTEQSHDSDRTYKAGYPDRTVARLMAEMPEIGTLSNKTISKLAGLAPLANDSGQHQGRRAVRGGRSAIREILFIVGSVVARCEPDFIAFQQRLRTAGKPPKVVRIAVAHKLLVRLNAKAREVRQHRTRRIPHRTAESPARLIHAAVVEVVGKRETAPSFSAFPSTLS
jgi:hypothetical protein